jgi:hypothetical protein
VKPLHLADKGRRLEPQDRSGSLGPIDASLAHGERIGDAASRRVFEAHGGQSAFTSSSGSKKLVVVEFGSTPPGSIAEVRRHVEAIVARSFEGGVDHITLVF